MDKGLKVSETDELVIFVIFVMVSFRGGRGFQRLGAEMRKERLENSGLHVRGGTERQRYSDERVLPDGLALMSLRRYCG